MSARDVGIACALLGLVVSAGCASSPGIFPERVDSWRLAESASYDRSSLFGYIDGGAEVYLAYGFRELQVRMYRSPGKPEIAAELYDMGPGEDAYGVLSVDPTGEQVEIGAMGRYGVGLLRFCKGQWFVRVLAERETPETRKVVLALGERMAAGIREESPFPELLKALPEEGLRADSTTYFHTQLTLNQRYYVAEENLLGLGPETEAVIAEYEGDARPMKLLVVRYRSKEECAKARNQFGNSYLGPGPETEGPAVRQLEGGVWAGVEARPPYLVLVFEAPEAGAAKELLDRAGSKVAGGRNDG